MVLAFSKSIFGDEEEFLGVPLTPPKRVTHFPRLEEGNVPINTSWICSSSSLALLLLALAQDDELAGAVVPTRRRNIYHTARAAIDLLKDTFGDRLISHFGPVNWPPRSCDLTSLDYFLWGYVKSLVYADKPQTLDHLEDNIRRVIADIRPQMLEKAIENWTSRLDYIRASRGSPMPEIIFKM
ncbi:transposase [Trichonephila clavipes]|uniref:Transposase n=1 Tax=Trichonephila clavipes TaxID=2585209 RepID=A0A8X6RM39_TRICX|nr:transposase [Trichonephila clavipes]